MATTVAPNVGHLSGGHPASLEATPQNPGVTGSGDPASSDEIEIPSPLLQLHHPDKNWHDKDPILRMFDYLELQAYGHAFGPYWSAKCSLDNNIHPLFQDLVEVPGLQPALRLASKFLSEPNILPFWHALIFNDCSPLQQETQNIGWPCHQISLNPGPLSPADVEKTESALLRIAKDVSITSHSNPCFESMWAFTKRTRHNIKTTDPGGEKSVGTSSYVTISPRTFKLLHPDTFMPQDQRNRISFMLAVTLCHEFAHAVYMFCAPLPLLQDGSMQPPGVSDEIEPFINNDRTPELGRAWESIVFGGQLNSLGAREDCRYGLGLTKWPGSKTEYCINQTSRAIVPIARVDASATKWETHYVIPMDFIEKLFNRNYWEQDFKQRGVESLRFEKKLGCRKRNYDWVDSDLGDGYGTDDSERSRHADRDGIVRPDQPHLPSPNLSELDEEHEFSPTESEASGFPSGYSNNGGSEFDPYNPTNWTSDTINLDDVDDGDDESILRLIIPMFSDAVRAGILPQGIFDNDSSDGEWGSRMPGAYPVSFSSTTSEASGSSEESLYDHILSPEDPLTLSMPEIEFFEDEPSTSGF